jgi:hypothetical protein
MADEMPPLDRWSLARPLWVIVMSHPEQQTTTLLQAEAWGQTFLLAFTSDAKARHAIDRLGVAERGAATLVAADAEVALVTAMCRVGAQGILVDFDPDSRRCAWSRRRTASA